VQGRREDQRRVGNIVGKQFGQRAEVRADAAARDLRHMREVQWLAAAGGGRARRLTQFRDPARAMAMVGGEGGNGLLGRCRTQRAAP